MSLYLQYQSLEISFLQTKCEMMKSLSTEDGFVNAVMAERSYVGSFKEAFDNINALHNKLFTSKRYKSFEEFKAKALK